MAETSNIAEVAKLVSSDIFEVFGWKVTGPCDDNFTCVRHDVHKTKARTHPADIVFYYDDPYIPKRTYIHTDLKSYSSSTLSTFQLSSALRSMGQTVDCANTSPSWHSKYDLGHSHDVVGLLFIYNHDQMYDKDFMRKLVDVQPDSFELLPENRFFVMGPQAVNYLYTVASDINQQKGKKTLQETSFYYPDHNDTGLRATDTPQVMTIETLLGPWQIVRNRSAGESLDDYVVYYPGAGDSIEEFQFLIDYLVRYQLVSTGRLIRIRAAHANGDTPAIFARAKQMYIEKLSQGIGARVSLPDDDKDYFRHLEDRFRRVRFEAIPGIRTQFSPIQIGMEGR